MAKKLTIGVAFLGLVLSATAGWLLHGKQASVASGFYSERLLACDTRNQGGEELGHKASSQQCVADVMTLALANDDVAGFLPELEQTVNKNDFLYTVCHPAAHTAGKQALEASDDLFELLNEVAKSTVCDWGFGHGVIDTLALRGEDNETLTDLVNWCEDHVSDGRLYGLCSDSIGHYSWISTGDLERSVVNCTLVQTPQGKSSCGGGIMMQMFEPAASAGSYSRLEAPALIPEICERWVKVAPVEMDNLGCSHGAGYVYGLNVRDAAWAWLNDEKSIGANTTPQIRFEAVAAAIATETTNCRKLPVAPDYCIRQVMHAIPLQWAHRFPDDHARLCSLFTDTDIATSCMQRREQKSI